MVENSILARTLSGMGTDPIAEGGDYGLLKYLSQYEVNPYWQNLMPQHAQDVLSAPAGDRQVLIDALPAQNLPQHTQGNENPYYQPEASPATAPQPATPSYSTNVVGGYKHGKWNGETGTLSGRSGQIDNLVMEDGRTLSGAHIQKVINDLHHNPDRQYRADALASIGSLFGADAAHGGGHVIAPGKIHEAFIPDYWKK